MKRKRIAKTPAAKPAVRRSASSPLEGEREPLNPPSDTAEDKAARTLSDLSASAVYRDYERAFVAGTGLPLSLHAPDMLTMVRHARNQQNPFCGLMAKTNQSCSACYALQCKLESEAQLAPKTLKCFAGMCETAVPVRVGDNIIAFLQTGQILLHRTDKAKFNRVARTLVRWGSEVDLKKAEEAYFNTRVLAPKQYEALIRLLEIFATHLAACSTVLARAAERPQRAEITEARTYITEHYRDEMSLETVAHFVNMSANYFSEKFTGATGMHFVEYVTRTRIEKACTGLQDHSLRISEIAFEIGFQSLSQFNRAFKQITGKSPREYRRGLTSS